MKHVVRVGKGLLWILFILLMVWSFEQFIWLRVLYMVILGTALCYILGKITESK